MIRVPVRIAGKLVSFRIEEPSLEDIDRMARSQGMDRSRWIRHACHVQLVLDMIENGDGHQLHEPVELHDAMTIEEAVEITMQASVPAPDPALVALADELGITAADPQPTAPPVREGGRPNRWS